MQPFHQERLQRAGLAPRAQVEPAVAQAVQPVEAVPEQSQAEFYEIADNDSDLTVSPPPTPRPTLVDQPSSSSALEPVGGSLEQACGPQAQSQDS